MRQHPAFPTPFPDESIFSLLCRFHLLSAGASFKKNTLSVIGVNGSRPSNEFPGYLPSIAKLSGISMEYIIEHMTSVQYYKPFISNDIFQLLIGALETGGTGSLQSKLGNVASRLTPGQTLNYCPKCVEIDFKKYGAAYWHKVHQLIGITVCPVHGCYLGTVQRNSIKILLSPNYTREVNALAEEFDFNKLICEEFFDFEFRLSLSDVYKTYRNQLLELGFVTEANHIRQRLLRKFIAGKLNLLAKNSAIFKVLEEQCIKERYPETLFYNNFRYHHPIKHLALIYLLFGNWKAFKKSVISKERSIETTKPTKTCSTLKIDWTIGLRMLKSGHSLRYAARAIGTTIATLKIKAQQQNLPLDCRPSKVFDTEQRMIWRKLFVGQGCKNIAETMNFSIGAVEKILTRYPELVVLRKKIRFKNRLNQHRQKIAQLKLELSTRNEIKSAAPASYIWLFKHDKSWLYRNLPIDIPRKSRYKNRGT
ncbi:hypothetical protein N480_09705 [Pseudoalteromonas luteoviolacea S2607]|uniref:TnsD family Tn7-like transposition protein n=1 Tax=Pseudoalteromonas luteoviolacea TaxID=43657 RepID=UPI0007B03D37|nr:TnsD family Tn7-like transposition protein [Pseudoalteromonas luteoviolacea]KZN29033.1 hypothetical protein N480_09705 [Pseudoalteromonas luteoviolacea S2607]